MARNNTFIRSRWYKCQDYVILDDAYLIPKEGSEITHYDPISQNTKFKKLRKNEIFTDLRKIHEGKNENQKQKLAIKFAKTWGLLGIFGHSTYEIKLAPRLLALDIEMIEKDSELKKRIDSHKGTLILNGSETKDTGAKIPESNFIDTGKTNSKSKVLAPIQPIYTFFKEGWRVSESKILDLNDINKIKNLDYGSLIPLQYIKKPFNDSTGKFNKNISRFELPGFWYKSWHKGSSNAMEHFKYKNNIEMLTFTEGEEDFISHFPLIKKAIYGSGKDEINYKHFVEYFAWPFPDSIRFYYSYGEKLEHIYEASAQVASMLKDFSSQRNHIDKAGKIFKKKLRQKYKNHNNFDSIIDMATGSMYREGLKKFTSRLELTPSVADRKAGFDLAPHSLIAPIGYTIVENLTSDRYARCCLKCDTNIDYPKPNQKFCQDNCRITYWTANDRKKKKIMTSKNTYS